MPDPHDQWAIVDMGSNGIRFSITSLAAPTARILPTVYQSRAAISLYDAQYSETGDRQAIDDDTITAVCKAMRRFKRVCADFDVPPDQIRVLATEATRTAPNSSEFRNSISVAVGWDVTMLSKEDEGRFGAMGVASSVPEINGLVMDLGGGSIQLSYLSSDDRVNLGARAVSLPYGAAALTRRIKEAEAKGRLQELRDEIRGALHAACKELNVPVEKQTLSTRSEATTLYLSGGGFRGWGYVLMSQHSVRPYPVPIVNGFKVLRQDFLDVESVTTVAAAALNNGGEEAEIFRVSDRRAGQVPAVELLVTALTQVWPDIRQIRFCQGGVREGYLSSLLTEEIRRQHPLEVATQPFQIRSSNQITRLIQQSLPKVQRSPIYLNPPGIFDGAVIQAFANMLYYHANYPKDLQMSAALRSTTTGCLGNVHGLLHEHRVILALLLCARWDGDLPPVDALFKSNMELLVPSPEVLWWVNYLGAVASLIGTAYPAGLIGGPNQSIGFLSSWQRADEGKPSLILHVSLHKDDDREIFAKEIDSIQKVGKRKRWIGGRDGVGFKVHVIVTTDESSSP